MRREGFELEISKPQVITKVINGTLQEPFEEVTIEVDNRFVGVINEELGKRKATLINMHSYGESVRLVYKISDQNLLGLRVVF
jgi:GTP-binding protein